MMMQEEFDDENHRSMNYNKIDRCQDNHSIDNDESYRQLLVSSHTYFHFKQDITIQISFTNHLRLILFVFLFFTSQTHALPMYYPFSPNSGNYIPYVQTTSTSLPIAMVQLTDQSAHLSQSYRVYRRIPNPIPSYSNGGLVQNSDQQQSIVMIQNQQLRRERQRRAMIDKIVTIFDEDGNGQLTKDELYSMALRSNMFPKFHHYLKQTPI